ncbi:MAG TPA: TIGR03862 family flavoprotein [Chthoniobacterales bacterium]
MKKVAIVGAGPAGLRAAEVLAESGVSAVTVFDQRPSAGRKFLVAGRGGLNLTHSEPLAQFVTRYSAGPWERMLRVFGPEDLRVWAAGRGVETFVGTSGRVFPVEKQAARLLRRWIARLRELGVDFRVKNRLTAIRPGPLVGLQIDGAWHEFDAVILALGGASWPETGSDGSWPAMLTGHGISITPWQPANCGWEVDWPAEFLERFDGLPLKNLAVTAAGHRVRGELLITKYGLEGGALYQLGSRLRKMEKPLLEINFRPDATRPVSLERLPAPVRWLLKNRARGIQDVHSFPLPLQKPRPIDEAISSAGGVAWDELDETLQLYKAPGVFVCGEMIDWEGPTGGYLLQGCFTTATVAAQGAVARVAASVKPPATTG